MEHEYRGIYVQMPNQQTESKSPPENFMLKGIIVQGIIITLIACILMQWYFMYGAYNRGYNQGVRDAPKLESEASIVLYL